MSADQAVSLTLGSLMSSDAIQNEYRKQNYALVTSRVSEISGFRHRSSWYGALEPSAGRWLSPFTARETFCNSGRSFPMPMQLAEACMSAEFINLHLFMGRRGGGGGESARWGGGGGGRWEATLVPALSRPKREL